MKIRRYHPIVLLAAAALGSGCARMTALQEPEPVAIAFSVSAGDYLATRAEGEIPTDEVLRAGSGFGVFACYTGAHKYSESSVSPDFMYNQKVTYNPGIPAWEYSPVKYWPNGEGEPVGETGENPHYVSFFAYAPYSDGTS
ncbi:MAG: hypothetical protein IJV37_04230, partial [Bacteroidales bacterium]|nr:hypothetical protein [Bacteroidales bacterium]